MQLLKILVFQLGGLTSEVFEQLGDKRPCPGSWIKNLYLAVNEVLAEVLLTEPIGALDHETDDLIGRIDHAQPVGSFLVIDLVEVFVDDFEKRLLLVVSLDLRGSSADGRVVRGQRLERLKLGVAGEERGFQLVKFTRDVVVLVKRRVGEDFRENLFRQHVLDQHLSHIRVREARVDGLMRVDEEAF